MSNPIDLEAALRLADEAGTTREVDALVYTVRQLVEAIKAERRRCADIAMAWSGRDSGMAVEIANEILGDASEDGERE